jgi:ADP-ribose pyrophosphatase YjhB (NUDIX family)
MIIGGGCIIINDGKVLLMKRKNAKYFNNCFANPGGKIELGETIEGGIIREASEELGVKIVLKNNLGVYKWKEGEIQGEFRRLRSRNNSRDTQDYGKRKGREFGVV